MSKTTLPSFEHLDIPLWSRSLGVTRMSQASIRTTTMSTASYLSTCAFCKVIQGKEPSFMLEETDMSYAFMALPPVTAGHALVVPKYHVAKMHDLPDEYLADVIAVTKRVALSQGLENYNIIQNNGRIAYQSVDHVHFHVIDKPDAKSGLLVTWPSRLSPEKFRMYCAQLFKKFSATGKTRLGGKRIRRAASVEDDNPLRGWQVYSEAMARISMGQE